MVKILKGSEGTVKVIFPCNPVLVEKIRYIDGRKWHSEEKFWSLPNTDEILERM